MNPDYINPTLKIYDFLDLFIHFAMKNSNYPDRVIKRGNLYQYFIDNILPNIKNEDDCFLNSVIHARLLNVKNSEQIGYVTNLERVKTFKSRAFEDAVRDYQHYFINEYKFKKFQEYLESANKISALARFIRDNNRVDTPRLAWDIARFMSMSYYTNISYNGYFNLKAEENRGLLVINLDVKINFWELLKYTNRFLPLDEFKLQYNLGQFWEYIEENFDDFYYIRDLLAY